MIPQYLDLTKKGGAPARLAILRNAAALTNAPDSTLPSSRRFADWRAARARNLTNWRAAHGELSQTFDIENAGTKWEKRTPVWITHAGPEFRDERYCDKVTPRLFNHNGWFADVHCSNTVRGIVGRLSRGRFIAGYEVSDSGERVYFAHVFKDERDAAIYGDKEAEKHAETQREYSERCQQADKLRDKCEGAIERLRAYLSARNDKRTAARELAECEIATIRSIRAELADDFADIEL